MNQWKNDQIYTPKGVEMICLHTYKTATLYIRSALPKIFHTLKEMNNSRLGFKWKLI